MKKIIVIMLLCALVSVFLVGCNKAAEEKHMKRNTMDIEGKSLSEYAEEQRRLESESAEPETNQNGIRDVDMDNP